MKTFKIGVIGCGSIATGAHIPAYKADKRAEIAYFCDILPERAQAAADAYGSGRAVADYSIVLNDPQVDAVSVCVPNNLHGTIASQALRAGKHALCEKPAAPTYAEALEMQRAKAESGLILNIGVVNRFNDSVNKIRDYIRGGRLGEVFHVYISFRSHRAIPGLGGAFTTKAVSGGGVLIDWGVHFLDLVMYCCGDPAPLTVSGEVFSRLGRDIDGYAYKSMWAGPPVPGGTYDVEDSVTALIRTSGPVLTLNGAWAQNIGEDEMFIDFMGDKGGIRLNYGGDFTVYTAEHGALASYVPEFPQRNAFETEISGFLDCLETGKEGPSGIDTAIITARIMQGIYDSAAAHKELDLT
ncbi:Gfo/Idh/MocA family oxidoreductase [Ruminococcaceae bacterium OttesenSCG-928-D13]|nr:Gfo/Idh/MocA family oxidoreductase [Ruminococcaceae bacterium OttesenSCG-928-D13]